LHRRGLLIIVAAPKGEPPVSEAVISPSALSSATCPPPSAAGVDLLPASALPISTMAMNAPMK